MTKKKKIIIIVVIVIAAALAAVLLLKDRIGIGGGSGTDGEVYVESVADLTGANDAGVQNRYSGVVESQDTWDVNLNSEQTVKEIYVSEGDAVEAGTQLFAYDTADLQLQLSQAKLEEEEIGNEISNYNSQIKTLNAEKAAASKDEQFNYTTQIQSLQTEIKQAEYNRESKKMEIQKLQTSIEQSVVTSKIAGVVKSVNESGGTDDSGNALPFISILSTGEYRVKGLINETNVYMISEGQTVILRSRVDEEQTWTGTITTIDTGNAQTGSSTIYSDSDSSTSSSKYPFYIQLDSADGLMLGQHLYIEMDEGQAEAKEGIWLYSGYVASDDEGSYVWADNGSGKLEKRTVELGEYDEELDQYEILSGLTTDDYIAWPDESYTTGMKTTVIMNEVLTDDSIMDEEMTDDMSIEEGTTEDGLIDDGTADEDVSEEEIVNDGTTDGELQTE